MRDGCSESATKSYDGCDEKCDSHGGPVVQDVDQKADNDQKADSSAESTQCCASNTNAPVRIKSDGDDGDVTQSNSSERPLGRGQQERAPTRRPCSRPARAAATRCRRSSQKADSYQDASSDATSHQYGASDERTRRFRIKSDGNDGDVKQSNDFAAYSAAGNKNDTDQDATQDAGSAPVKESKCKDGCGHGDGGPVVQYIGQKASNEQDGRVACRLDPEGREQHQHPRAHQELRGRRRCLAVQLLPAIGGREPEQTDQSADQSAGAVAAPTVQAIGQKAENAQDADLARHVRAGRRQQHNAPVRIKNAGYDGGVKQAKLRGLLGGGEQEQHHAARLPERRRHAPQARSRDWGCGSCGGDAPPCRASPSGRRASSRPTRRRTPRRRAPATPTPRFASRAAATMVTSSRSNASTAKSAAGNENETDRVGRSVRRLGRHRGSRRSARRPTTVRTPSRTRRPSSTTRATPTPRFASRTGGGGSLYQSNESEALSAAGNRNRTCQRAYQGSGGDPKCDPASASRSTR